MTNTNSPDFDVIIIGAGISGLSAARHLAAAGKSVCVLDKGRRIGGRVSTRRQDGVIFNHGAQFFTAKDAGFQALAQDALSEGAASLWEFGHHSPAYIGAPTMRDFASYLGRGLEVRQSVKIISLTNKKPLYQLEDDTGQQYTASQILVTIPAPQAVTLVAPCDDLLARTAQSASYDPCWTAMLALTDETDHFADLPLRDQGPIGWATYEPSRHNGGYAPALTLQASPHASRTMIDWQPSDVISHLRQAFETQLGVTLDVRFDTAHRWLYARVAKTADPDLPYISHDQGLALAGDYFGTARVESAYLSGRRAAMALLRST